MSSYATWPSAWAHMQAVKQFRMALDATPPAYRRLRLNAQRNIGLAMVRSGRYREAAEAFVVVMQEGPDHQTAYNLVLCAAALGDAALMRSSFTQLLQVWWGEAGPAGFGAPVHACACTRW